MGGVREVSRCYHELGLRGLSIVCDFHNMDLSDKRCWPLYAKAAELGNAMLRAFSGRRWAVQKLQDKLRQVEGGSEPKGPQVDELRTRIREELTKQEAATDALARRYGTDALALLRAREAELVDLHTRMTRLLSRG